MPQQFLLQNMSSYQTFVSATKKYATTKIVANQSCLVMGVVNRSTLVNLSASLQGLINVENGINVDSGFLQAKV